MSELQDKDESAYKRQFGKYIDSGISADGVGIFKQFSVSKKYIVYFR